ncbi:glycoside hydrolase family 32 protein [Saccharibacillus brassicae]|uniref:Sucrose-6-phosphate hydrolase n=1 Tax=Saccharibacillus brassicae TaxID=2583377 RepID=A0A4Y6UQB8_SACBS|nr:glycoside hydrolase family 32 protein [Saccharibacillus brassicae]QDH19823.1 glycoside hydrolase family 32 protein [Saccharibacillus brassicae]
MTESQQSHRRALERAELSIAEQQAAAAADPWRLRYHIAAPAYWINDPNGFCFFRGEYHLFYQHHPFSPQWGPMYWGHAKSADLAHWEHLPIALAPSEDYDADGCFSGSAIEKDGRLWLMYTGNRWTGPDREADLLQVQALAVSDDGTTFEKYAGNPVIAEAPAGNIHPFHFRDPKVWEHEGAYYCVLGSRTPDHLGQVLLYRSDTLTDWSFVGIMAGGREPAGKLGYMWECPDLFELGGVHVLAFSPQGVAPDGESYLNLHQAGYVLGTLDYGTGTLEHGEFRTLDYGFDFYAPQTTLDDRGRRILIAWMAMWESGMPEQARGWAGAMTLPRVLTLEHGRIAVRPAPELESLRGAETRYAEETIASVAADGLLRGREFPGVSGECVELEVEFEAGTAPVFGIALRIGEDRGEHTVLAYARDEERLILDRERSGAGPGGVRRAPLALREERLRLRIFVDRSSVEVFAGDGELTMTARIYPDAASTGIAFFAEGGEAKILSLRCWPLDR